MAMVLTGGCLVQLDRFHPGSWWDSVRESRATVVHYLGVMPAMLLGAPPSPTTARTRVRFGFGAGRRPAASTRRSKQRFGFPLLEAWAMTETGAGAVVIANHEPRQVGTQLLRPRRSGTCSGAWSATTAPTCPPASPASCWCAQPAPTRGAASSATT